MNGFFITKDNQVQPLQADAEVPDGAMRFWSEPELMALAGNWPTARLVEIWNGLAGVKRVRRFTDRQTGVRRLWTAVCAMAQPETNHGLTPRSNTKTTAQKRRPTTRRNNAQKASKTGTILEMLRQPAGVTLTALVQTTKWQPHSVRGFLSGHVSKKLGLHLVSSKRDGERVYYLARQDA